MTSSTEMYTLSLHDALPISRDLSDGVCDHRWQRTRANRSRPQFAGAGIVEQQRPAGTRSEEHTSELQSPVHRVCRLLLEKKKASAFPQSDTASHHNIQLQLL